MVKHRFLSGIAFLTCIIALSTIALGAFTRLIDAGLSCPDWPGCYGNLFPTSSVTNNAKIWAEMIHRYAVSALSMMILVILFVIFCQKKLRSPYNMVLAFLLIFLICYQIILGQLTVTLKLLPFIVTQHLLGGFFILSFLWLIFLGNKKNFIYRPNKIILPWAILGIILLLFQIFLGAWTSTHYASLSCPDFPFCINDTPWLKMQWKHIFNFDFFNSSHISYEGGILPENVKQSIQMTHRLGALVLTLYLFLFISFTTLKLKSSSHFMNILMFILGCLCLQIALGIINVLLKLPLISAISHNLMAALLLLSLLTLIFKLIFVEKNHDSNSSLF